MDSARRVPSALCQKRRPGSRTAQKMRSSQRREQGIMLDARIKRILENQITAPQRISVSNSGIKRETSHKPTRIPKKTRRVILHCMEGVLTVLLRRASHNVYTTTKRTTLLPRDVEMALDDFTMQNGSFSF